MAKDEGYSWVVFVTALFSQLSFGVYTYGCLAVFTYMWIEKFSITTDTVAWASSILSSILLLTGPVIAVILQSIGCWRTQLIGCLLPVAAGVGTAFASQFWHVVVSYSLLQGFGYAMTQLASLDVVAIYFDKHKDKVYAGLMTSFCAGLLVGPKMTEKLFENLGYRDCMLIIVALNALNIPSGFIYRGFRCRDSKSPPSESDATGSTDGNKLDDLEGRESPTLTSDGVAVVDDKLSGDDEGERVVRESFTLVARRHLHVLSQPAFALVLTHYLLSAAGENTVYTLAVDFFVSKDVLTLSEATLGMTLCGVSTVVGSILIAVLSHWPLDRLLMSVTTNLAFGLAAILLPVCQDVTSSFALLIVFGLSNSMYAANTISFLVQQFGDENGSSLVRISYAFFCMGVGSLVGPVAAGNLKTTVGPDSMFYTLGALPILSSLMLVPYWVALKYRNRKESQGSRTSE